MAQERVAHVVHIEVFGVGFLGHRDLVGVKAGILAAVESSKGNEGVVVSVSFPEDALEELEERSQRAVLVKITSFAPVRSVYPVDARNMAKKIGDALVKIGLSGGNICTVIVDQSATIIRSAEAAVPV